MVQEAAVAAVPPEMAELVLIVLHLIPVELVALGQLLLFLAHPLPMQVVEVVATTQPVERVALAVVVQVEALAVLVLAAQQILAVVAVGVAVTEMVVQAAPVLSSSNTPCKHMVLLYLLQAIHG
jgi:hypothetical protein